MLHHPPAQNPDVQDVAHRNTTAVGYTYDQLGRTLTIPAADAPSPTDGPIELRYYATDAARSITQNGATTSYTLDPGSPRRDSAYRVVD